MNIIKRILIIAASIAALVSCSSKTGIEPAPEYLDVNANNISGNWKLESLNGESLVGETFMYMKIVRNDKTFSIWYNMDSFSDIPHHSTGEYNITKDIEHGDLIQGKYNYDGGMWDHIYIVRELTADQMTWVALDNPDYIQTFVRIDKIEYDTEEGL